MNKDEIMNMPAGREMDALIARHVIFDDVSGGVEDVDMETETVVVHDGGFWFDYYSTTTKGAVLVLDAMIQKGKIDDLFEYTTLWLDASPLAVCRAALMVELT